MRKLLSFCRHIESKYVVSMVKVCGICTDVGNSVAGIADDGLIVIQRKKNLGLLAASYYPFISYTKNLSKHSHALSHPVLLVEYVTALLMC